MTAILWHSNSPLASTGYGQQTQIMAPRLMDSGEHVVGISAFYGQEGAPILYESRGHQIPILPGLGGEFGNPYIQGHASAFFGGDPKAGLVVTLIDALALSSAVYSKLHTACWTPVDHDPATPTQREFFGTSGAIPIAMTRYGQEQLADFDPLYCPHGIETNTFRPLDRAEVREAHGIKPEEFAVGMIAANKGNPSRKCFVEALSAFARFRERHENALLYLHTEVSGQVAGGVPILEVAGALGIPPESISRADQYRLLFNPHPPEEMAAIYNSFDVLLAPSSGEGFGLPHLEAQACGVPVIATDHSAMKEVVQAGWKVDGQKIWTGQRSWQLLPYVDQIYEALEECYGLSTEEREALAKKARDHAVTYDADFVTKKFMLPAIAEISERLGDLPEMNGRGDPAKVPGRDWIAPDRVVKE